MSSNSRNNNAKPDQLMINLVNIGFFILVIIIVVVIYRIFISKSRNEGFTATSTTIPLPNNRASNASNLTIYEIGLTQKYGDNKRLMCSLNPTGRVNNICSINGENFVVYNFPVHMIKLLNGSILAVFNDGRLYSKDTISNTMWLGPLQNSLPNDSIPLRMITLANDLRTLLGVGYDNKLYMKRPTDKGELDITATWQLVPNNTGIIYVFYDNESNNLVSIDINGRLRIKDSSDITSASRELITRLDRPVLRIYYDMNGYALAIDSRFQLYQFSELNWKNSVLNLQRGANNSRLQDVMYDTDGTMYGLVFNPENYMLQIMKQTQPWYLGDFIALDNLINTSGGDSVEGGKFVMSIRDIIQSKTGSISEYLRLVDADDSIDEDPNIAYQKQLFETRAKLKDFCNNRYSTTAGSTNYENWNLYSGIEGNENKITNMKNVINNLLKYEPDRQRFLDNYPIISNL